MVELYARGWFNTLHILKILKPGTQTSDIICLVTLMILEICNQ
jgi:hypothetical protein